MNYKFGLLPGLASLLTDWALISGSVRCAPYYCARSFERPDVAHVLPVDLLSSNLFKEKTNKTNHNKKIDNFCFFFLKIRRSIYKTSEFLLNQTTLSNAELGYLVNMKNC